jgi:Tol biopolymer transport system component
MGEVYRATDTRLGRDVAIKVLPPELASRSEFRTRLEREARAISRLSHPHICTLYDLGVEGETTFLVMELLDGQLLSDRLRQGSIPLPEALHLAVEIASALAAAHQQGLVHRDLKPGNVMLTSDGAKLLDFGLARTLTEESVVEDNAESPTLEAPLTREGAILGTPQYMAPEQVVGEPADARTDIFAFGSLLYEMLSGDKAFSGGDRRALAAAILHDEPRPLDALREGLPPPLARLVGKCLAKEPAARWQCAADLCDELRWIESLTQEAATGTGASRKRLRGRAVALGGVAAAIIAAIGLSVGWTLAGGMGHAGESAQSADASHVSIQLPEEAPFLPETRSALAISPDGRQIAYVGGDLADKRLYVRSLDGDAVQPLDGTADAVGPFFSPDGRRIGFFTRYVLEQVASTGGPAQRISSAPPVTRGAAWLESGDIVVSPSKAAPLFRVALSENTAILPFTKPDPAVGSGQIWPAMFDHDKKVLVTILGGTSTSYNDAKIVGIDLSTGKETVIVEGGSQALYLPSGYLVFIREGSLFAAPFDAHSMRLTASPVAVLDHVLSDPTNGIGHFAVSASGTLVYARGGTFSSNEASLAWMDRSGNETTIPADPREIFTPRLSPDGHQIALSIQAATDDLWLFDLDRGTYRRLTFGNRNLNPIWTPDGTRITYSSVRGVGYPAIYTLAADGSGHEELLAKGNGEAYFPGSWAPDGKTLAFSRLGGKTGWDVEVLTGDGSTRPLIASRFNESAPAISPSGAWLAYCSDESGRFEVYVTSFPQPGKRLQVSVNGGTQPLWSGRGDELLYRSGNRLMSVEIETESALHASAPTEVIGQLPPATTSSAVGAPSFDVAPGDQRFLVVHRHPLPRVDHLDVIFNWFAELERRAPRPE